jgi:hypothetical protein
VTFTLRRLLSLLATTLLVSLALPLAGQAVLSSASASEPSLESQLLGLTNTARANAGLSALESSSTLVSIARSWSGHMAASGTLSHNPSLASQVGGWSMIGENVAKAYSASQAQQLFMASSGHRDNILQTKYNRVGIGVTQAADGSLWFTVDFEQTSGFQPPAASTAPVTKPKATKRTATRSTASSAAARLLAARQAAANRANRSLTRGALPTLVPRAVTAPPLAAADALARAGRLGAQEGAPDLLAGADLALGLGESSPGDPAAPTSLLVLAAITLLSVFGAMATQLVLQRPSRRPG